MEDTSLWTRFRQFLSNNKLKVGTIVTGAITIFFVGTTFFYYIKTSSATVLVTTEDFPPGFARFTQNDLMDQVADRLNRIVTTGESANQPALSERFGLVPAKEHTFRAVSDPASPVFKLQWKGFSLSFCRRIGMSLRAKKFLSLRVNDVSDKGWRLSAMMSEAPQYSAQSIGSVPPAGALCSEFQSCADDLAEQIMRSVDRTSLLNFYSSQNNNDKIMQLYEAADPGSLQPNDLVRWGDALFAQKDEEKALAKYEQALRTDANSCRALAARGYFYDKTAKRDLNKLKKAEQDLWNAVKCNPQDKFALTSLCHTLTQEWKQTQGQPQLLETARQNCQRALDIDPAFVIAATNIGYILYRQGKHAEALSYFSSLTQQHNQDSALFVNYGFLLYLEYLNTKNASLLTEAIQQTGRSFSIDPANYIAAANLGYFNYENRNYEAAASFFNKGISLKPNEPDLLAGLAIASYKLGRTDQAISLLKQARDGDPKYGQPDRLIGDPAHWSAQMVADLRVFVGRLPPV